MAKLTQLEKLSVESVVITVAAVMVGIQVLAYLLGFFIPQLTAIKLGPGFMLLAMITLAILPFLLTRRGFRDFRSSDVFIVLLVIALSIAMLWFLPETVPDIFSVAMQKTFALIGVGG